MDYVFRSQTVMALMVNSFLGVLRGAILRANALLFDQPAVDRPHSARHASRG
jgi:hypothetical protein